MDPRRLLGLRLLRLLNRGGTAVGGILLLVLPVVPIVVSAQSPCPAPPPPFQSLRYEENYQFLGNPACHIDFWDPVKFLPLNEVGDSYVTMGGEVRERYEYYKNNLWGQGPQDSNGFLLQRYTLHADLRLGPDIRFFGQLSSNLETGRTGGPRPTDEDKLDVHQAFGDLRGSIGSTTLTLRAGRQEFSYGSERLVGVREGPNVRLSFDAVRLIAEADPWRMDAFVSRPVQTKRNIFDDDSDRTQAFWGVYAVGPLPALPAGKIDLYYLGVDRQGAGFDQGTASEQRHTLGARLWGQPGNWDYNVELIYQFGSFGSGTIQAWAASSNSGYTFRSVPLQPRIGLRAEVNSGDRDRNSRNLQTFNALFPNGSYFGEIGLIGPANLMDLHPSLDLHITQAVTLTLDWDWFWRESPSDGVYSPPGGLLRSGVGSGARYVGTQGEVQATWQIDRHLSVTANYTHFFTGAFLKQTGPAQDIDFVAAWVAYKF
ncbi:MAG: alginate export family protein [Candidatus Methylomirabilales bacterium]